MDNSYIIIADDFAGANDTGIQFIQAKAEHPLVLLDPSPMTIATHAPCNVLVIDSDMRNCNTEQTTQKIRGIGEALKQRKGKSKFYLKIDSSLRGNIAAAAHTLQQILNFDCVAYAPAYPQNGCTIINGILRLNVSPTQVGHSNPPPFPPMGSASVTDLLAFNGQKPMHISLDCIRNHTITQKLSNTKHNTVFFVFDTETETDLQCIADSVHKIYDEYRILWVGSAGLAHTLVRKENNNPLVQNPPVLAIVGSSYPINNIQIQEASIHEVASVYHININDFIHDPEKTASRIQQDLGNLLAQGRNLILSTSAHPLADTETPYPAPEVSTALLRFLPEIILVLLHNYQIQGLYLCGSKISAAILKRLGTYGAVLIREIEDGIPLLKLKGGLCNGLPVITKAGSFGDKGVLVRAITRLQNMDP